MSLTSAITSSLVRSNKSCLFCWHISAYVCYDSHNVDVVDWQALLFYTPIMLWRSLNSRSGIDVNNIVQAGETFQYTELLALQQAATLTYMTRQMDRYA